ncbi:LADA_0E02366g1_1 [Lachancea dasiensis]|uniref:LADA_0E02366g1_1 n=1 Tax=Lachancea dasiensis TaxID=1072105 RepID=A0A1G4JBE0_9SACH|nr:LADA_0E02366g1_1 [Lachancea dasiensis]
MTVARGPSHMYFAGSKSPPGLLGLPENQSTDFKSSHPHDRSEDTRSCAKDRLLKGPQAWGSDQQLAGDRRAPSLAKILASSPCACSSVDGERRPSKPIACTHSVSPSTEQLPHLPSSSDGTVSRHALDFRVRNYQVAGSQCTKLPVSFRKHSLDSLMTAVHAAETVDGCQDLSIQKADHEYQVRLGNIIQLKNGISETLRNWPLAKPSARDGVSYYCLLDSLSLTDMHKLLQASERLAIEAKELSQLKQRRECEVNGSAAIAVKDPTSYTHQPRRMPFLPPPHEMLAQHRYFQNTMPPGNAQSQTLPSCFKARSGQCSNQHQAVVRHDTIGRPVSVNEPCYGERGDPILPSFDKADTSQKLPDRDMTHRLFKIQKPIKCSMTAPELVQSPIKDVNESVRQKTSIGTMTCVHCSRKDTPEWRRGPYGNRTVCNACGLFYGKLVKKFGYHNANIMMHYRRTTMPEDRRVPSHFFVPQSFVRRLQVDQSLNRNFGITEGSLAYETGSGRI